MSRGALFVACVVLTGCNVDQSRTVERVVCASPAFYSEWGRSVELPDREGCHTEERRIGR